MATTIRTISIDLPKLIETAKAPTFDDNIESRTNKRSQKSALFTVPASPCRSDDTECGSYTNEMTTHTRAPVHEESDDAAEINRSSQEETMRHDNVARSISPSHWNQACTVVQVSHKHKSKAIASDPPKPTDTVKAAIFGDNAQSHMTEWNPDPSTRTDCGRKEYWRPEVRFGVMPLDTSLRPDVERDGNPKSDRPEDVTKKLNSREDVPRFYGVANNLDEDLQRTSMRGVYNHDATRTTPSPYARDVAQKAHNGQLCSALQGATRASRR